MGIKLEFERLRGCKLPNPQPSTLNPQHSTLNTQPLNPSTPQPLNYLNYLNYLNPTSQPSKVQLPPTLLEWTSVAGNIVFTILLGRSIRVGWLFGFGASVIGVWLYANESAWLMGALNAFYAAMGIYGWWNWGRIANVKNITTMSLREHIATIVAGLAITVGLVVLMRALGLEGQFQWMEAFIAAFAVLATWLMSIKVLENWIYWTVGDLVGVAYNHWMGFDGYALLMVVYIVLAVVGFVKWRRQMKIDVVAG